MINPELMRSVNYGNVVNSPSGPKVVDFLPHQHGQTYLPGKSFGEYAPNYKTDNLEMSPRQAKAEFYNPKLQAEKASPELQAKAKAQWSRVGRTPDFDVNAVPHHARMKQQAAVAMGAPTAQPTVQPMATAAASPAARRTPQPAPTSPLRSPAMSAPTAVVPKPSIAPAVRGALTALPKKLPAIHP